MSETILVTGGAGYIGSHVCKALAEAGHQPVCFDTLEKGHDWAVRWGPLERGDIGDAARLDDVFSRHRPSAVIHLAGYIEVGESMQPARALSAQQRGQVGCPDRSARCAMAWMPSSFPAPAPSMACRKRTC